MTTPRRTGPRPPRPSSTVAPSPAPVRAPEPAAGQPDRSRSVGGNRGHIRRRILPWVAAPLAMALVFGLGLAAVWMPAIPRVVTSSVGPTIGSVGEPVRLVVPSLDIDA